MRIIFTGGGSGGHVYPAIALLKQLKAYDPSCEVLYIGKKDAFESRVCEREGIPFKPIEVTYLYRKLIHKNIGTLMKFIKAKQKCKAYFDEFKPDVVIGTGGYVSAPVLSTAQKMGIKTIIHEQNSIPGLTNKWLSKYADTIAISFEESAKHFKHRHIVLTGNPRAVEVAKTQRINKAKLGLNPQKKFLLIFFGSQGGKYVNLKMAEILPLLDGITDCETIFVTGKGHYKEINERLEGVLLKQTKVVDYLDDMPNYLSVCDLVICRAGATTIAELTALGIPAIYIPSPNVTADHQTKNAQILKDHKAGVLMTEKDYNREQFLATVKGLMQDDVKRQTMGTNAKKLANIDAFQQFIEIIYH